MENSPLKPFAWVEFKTKVPADEVQSVLQAIADLAFDKGFADGATLHHGDIFYE